MKSLEQRREVSEIHKMMLDVERRGQWHWEGKPTVQGMNPGEAKDGSPGRGGGGCSGHGQKNQPGRTTELAVSGIN